MTLSALLNRLLVVVLVGFPGYALGGEDARWIRLDVRVEVHDDGRVDTFVHQEMEVHSLLARDKLCDPRFLTNEGQEKFSIVRARTIWPDGRSFEVTPRLMHHTTPDSVLSCPSFSSWKEWVVTLPAIVAGATWEIDMESRGIAGSPVAQGFYALGNGLSVAAGSVSVGVPAELPFHCTILGDLAGVRKLEPVQEAAHTIYRWELKDLPATEGTAQDRELRSPLLAYSTARDWGDATRPLAREMAREQTTLADGVLKSIPIGLPQDQVLWSILDRVKNSINLCGGLTTADESFRTPGEIWESRQATDIEASLLLSAVLRERGIATRLLLVSNRPLRKLQEDGTAGPDDLPPVMDLVPHPYVIAELDSGKVVIDAASLGVVATPEWEYGNQGVLLTSEGWDVDTGSVPTMGIFPEGFHIQVLLGLSTGSEGDRLECRVVLRGGSSAWSSFRNGAQLEALGNWVNRELGIAPTWIALRVDAWSPSETSFSLAGSLSAADGELKVQLSPAPFCGEPLARLSGWIRHGSPRPLPWSLYHDFRIGFGAGAGTEGGAGAGTEPGTLKVERDYLEVSHPPERSEPRTQWHRVVSLAGYRSGDSSQARVELVRSWLRQLEWPLFWSLE